MVMTLHSNNVTNTTCSYKFLYELRNLFIKPYSLIYNIDLDILIVHIVIRHFAMGQGDIR